MNTKPRGGLNILGSGRQWALTGATLVSSVGQVGANVLLAVSVKYLIDSFSSWQWSPLVKSWVFLGVTVIVVPLLMGVGQLLFGAQLQLLLSSIRRQLVDHYLKLPPGTARESVEGLDSRVVNDTAVLGETLGEVLPSLANALIGIGVGVALLTTWSTRVVLFVTLLAIIVARVNALFAGPLRKATATEQDQLKAVMEAGTTIAAGLLTIKALGVEDTCLDRFSRHVLAHRSAAARRGTLRAVSSAVSAASQNILFPSVEMAAGLMALSGQISVGTAEGASQLASQLVSPAAQLGQARSEWGRVSAVADRILSFLALPPEESDHRPDQTAQLGCHGTRISVREVNYRYAPGADLALNNVSIDIRAGSAVALVGESGSGKSTLLKILATLIDGYDGTVCLDGEPLNQVSCKAVRNAISLCPQDFGLLRATVRESLEMVIAADAMSTGSGPSDDDWLANYPDRVQRVLSAFGIVDMVAELQNGWDTMTTELSGGQRQRLALARAFVKGSPLVLLDEPFSHLDRQNEAIASQAIARFSRDCTLVMATHRITRLDWVSRVFVLARGQIIEQGTVDELIARDGTFAALYRTQLAEG